jgi:hypothetical protein
VLLTPALLWLELLLVLFQVAVACSTEAAEQVTQGDCTQSCAVVT